MEARALAKIVRVSSQKANLVADLIRYKKIDEAFAILDNSSKKSANLFKKVLNSAVANATENHGMTADELVIIRAIANEGPTMKRFRPRAKGRADEKLRRTSHLEIVVTDDYRRGKK
jgi:large subunit ribosomal protein L22